MATNEKMQGRRKNFKFSIIELSGFGANRRDLAKLIVFTLLFTFFEGLGIGLVLPVLEYITQGKTALNHENWPILYELLNILGFSSGRSGLFILLFLAFTCLLLRSIFHYIQDINGVKLSLTVATNLRKRAINHFLMSDFAFLSSKGTGRLFSALTMEAARAGEALKAQIVFFTSLALLLVYVILLCWLSWNLFLLTLPVFALVVLIFRHLRQILGGIGKTVSKLNNSFGRSVSEHLRGIDRVKMRAQEASAAGVLNQTVDDLAESSLDIERWRLLVDIGIFPVLVLSAFGVLFLAVEYLNMSISALGLFLFIMMRLAPQFTMLNGIWSHMHSCFASFKDLNGLIETARQHKECWDGTYHFHQLTTGLTIKQMGFVYPGPHDEKPALQNISCSIPKGSLTALVGRSGAGKSTFVKLVVGFYRAQRGKIVVDETSLEALDMASWRRKIAYLNQEPFLFDETIRDNLNYGLDKPLSKKQELEVLTRSHSQEFTTRLEKGLETRVGEAGQRLSQGQKQRLALAHALAVNPQLLILDEPTSALDAESEEAIQKMLMSAKGRITMIVIAHRLSTIGNADNILLLDQGTLVDQGSHEMLLENNPLYQSLFEKQMIR